MIDVNWAVNITSGKSSDMMGTFPVCFDLPWNYSYVLQLQRSLTYCEVYSMRKVALRSACFLGTVIFLLTFCRICFMLIVAIHLSSEFIRFKEISYSHQSLF